MKNDSKKRSIIDKAVDVFDLPGEVISGMPKLTVTGNRRVHIECHKGILEYDHNTIIVNGGSQLVKLRGEALEICSMTADELLIKGFIVSIEFD
jgi:sporulation protein YqfC